MSLPRYAEYKDSGVAWLGPMPSHWHLVRYKTVFKEREERSVDGSETLLSVSAYTGVSPRSEIIDDGDYLSRAESLEGYKVCYPDDLVMNIMLAWNRGLGFSPMHGIVSPAYCVFSVCDGSAPSFLNYLVRSDRMTIYFKAHSAGVIESRLRLYPDTFGALFCARPPHDEQCAIAAFLDRETRKIDALIAEQEKLLILLAEKRQATISHAVTRGLNPNAPMKDSGVPWLGEVPAHWDVGKIQSFAKRESGHTPSRQHPEYWEDCTIPWFSLADVWQIRSGDVKYVHETKESVSELGLANSSARLLPKGTVILSRTASVGYSAIMGCDMATTQDFVNWICKPDLLPEFLLYVLRGMQPEFDRLMMGSTHQTIYMPDIAKLMMTQPPIEEQVEIISFLEVVVGKLDNLKNEAESGIALLKERRSALIAAAVTGKIDVRQAA
jgi:type I restriction enzyme S subunit